MTRTQGIHALFIVTVCKLKSVMILSRPMLIVDTQMEDEEKKLPGGYFASLKRAVFGKINQMKSHTKNARLKHQQF